MIKYECTLDFIPPLHPSSLHPSSLHPSEEIGSGVVVIRVEGLVITLIVDMMYQYDGHWLDVWYRIDNGEGDEIDVEIGVVRVSCLFQVVRIPFTHRLSTCMPCPPNSSYDYRPISSL